MSGAVTILSVEYDPGLLFTRNRVLQQVGGYRIVAAANYRQALRAISAQPYAVTIIGDSVPCEDREAMECELRRLAPETRILVLYRKTDEKDAASDASVCSGDGPDILLGAVATMVAAGRIRPQAAAANASAANLAS